MFLECCESKGRTMENGLVIRSNSARVVPVLFSSLVIVIFIAELGSKHLTVKLLALLIIGICAVGIIRGARSGYVAIDANKLEVRTIYRTRTFVLGEILSVEPRTIMQATNRVMPVLILQRGHEYKISEFFMQKRSYDRSSSDNKVNNLVRVISESILNYKL